MFLSAKSILLQHDASHDVILLLFIYLFIYACGEKIRKNNNMRRELKPAQGKQGGEAELVVHGI
jgi:hypothetical protein